MRIVVCVKHVPSGRWRLDPASMTVERSGPGELNGVDKNAIEEALRLKESTGGEVVVLHRSALAVESLRTVLALGAARPVLVNDAAVAGSDLVATASAATGLEREGADLVLFGQQTSDGGGGVLWAAVAEPALAPSSPRPPGSCHGNGAGHAPDRVGDDVVEAPLPGIVAVWRRHQRASVRVTQGDDGGEEEAPRGGLPCRYRRPDAGEVGRPGPVPPCSPWRVRGCRQDRGRRHAAQAIVDFLETEQLL